MFFTRSKCSQRIYREATLQRLWQNLRRHIIYIVTCVSVYALLFTTSEQSNLPNTLGVQRQSCEAFQHWLKPFYFFLLHFHDSPTGSVLTGKAGNRPGPLEDSQGRANFTSEQCLKMWKPQRPQPPPA